MGQTSSTGFDTSDGWSSETPNGDIPIKCFHSNTLCETRTRVKICDGFGTINNKLFLITIIILIMTIQCIVFFKFYSVCICLILSHFPPAKLIPMEKSKCFESCPRHIKIASFDETVSQYDDIYHCKHNPPDYGDVFVNNKDDYEIPIEASEFCNIFPYCDEYKDTCINDKSCKLPYISNWEDDDLIKEIRHRTWLPFDKRPVPSTENLVYLVPEVETDSAEGATGGHVTTSDRKDSGYVSSELPRTAASTEAAADLNPEPPVKEAAPEVEGSLTPILDRISNGGAPRPQETMKYELLRLCTLRNYPKENKPYLTSLAKAGFYYAGNQDELVCYMCGVRKKGWTALDDPWQVHEMLTPQCRFLTSNSDYNIAIPGISDQQRDRLAIVDSIPEPAVVSGHQDQHRQESLGGVSRPLRGGVPASSMSQRTPLSGGGHTGLSSEVRRALPKYPQHAQRVSRLATFVDWSKGGELCKETMADCGFFYAGFTDCVRCFSCGIGLRNWEDGDSPWTEHARWGKNCVFLKTVKGTAFINRVQAVVEQSEAGSVGGNRADACHNSNQETHQPSASAGIESKTTGSDSSKNNQHSTSKANTTTLANKQSQRAKAIHKLKVENKKLKSQSVCHVCKIKENSIVYLPCAHLVACEECAVNQKHCGICKQYIKGTVRTYSS